MRLILLEDIEKIGKKYEVKEVSPGFARNFLLKEGKARPATKEALNWLESVKEKEKEKTEKEKEKIEKMISEIKGKKVVLEMKVGEKDQLFESVSSRKIAQKLKEEGIEVKENQIDLEEPIKSLGDFKIKIKFDHNLKTEINLKIKEEK